MGFLARSHEPMPRGECTRHPENQAKRLATYHQNRRRRAASHAARQLRRCVPNVEQAQACVRWIEAQGVRLDDPQLNPTTRRRWLTRALQATSGPDRPSREPKP